MDDSKRPGRRPPRVPPPGRPGSSNRRGPSNFNPPEPPRASNYMGDDEPTHVGVGYSGPAPVPRAPSAGVRSAPGAPTIAGVDGGPQRPDSYRPPLPSNVPAAGMPSYIPPPDPYLGTTIAGRYRVESKLGEGGMGTVYLATHVTLEKQVALKILHGELARRAELVQRFLQEAKAASRIRHENVIDITDFGSTQDGAVFFAMEVLEGHDLHDLIVRARADRSTLPWGRLRNIFVQVCSALSAAHESGVIHRDLKPENIYLIERRGTKDFVKLLDFGIAKLTEVSEGERKLTRTGMLFGTPEYMSPEQARGDKVDHRVDVYAMGCLLYQLIVGRVPFEADNFMGVLSRHLSDEPPVIPSAMLVDIGAPRSVNEVIQQALAKKAKDRYQSIEDLVFGLEQIERRTGSIPTVEPATGRMPSMRAPSGFESTSPAAVSADGVPETAEAVPAGSGPTGKRRYGQMATAITEPGRTSTEEPNERGQRPELTGGPELVAARQALAGDGRKSPFLLWAVLLFVLAGGGVGAFLMLGGKSDKARGGAAEPAVSKSRSAPASASQKASERDKVSVSLESEPSGAGVYDDTGAKLGVTPLELELERSSQARDFRFVLAGHEDKLVSIVPDKARGQQVALVPSTRPDERPDGDPSGSAEGSEQLDTGRDGDGTRRAGDNRGDRKAGDKDGDDKQRGDEPDDPTDDPAIKKPDDPTADPEIKKPDDPTADPEIKNPFGTQP